MFQLHVIHKLSNVLQLSTLWGHDSDIEKLHSQQTFYVQMLGDSIFELRHLLIPHSPPLPAST